MSHLIFLSSPYTCIGDLTIEDRKEEEKVRYEAAIWYMAKLMDRGEMIFSPIAHCHAAAIKHSLPTDWKYWKEYCELMIDRCQEVQVLMLPGWSDSKGVQAEISYATEKEIPVNYIPYLSEGENLETEDQVKEYNSVVIDSSMTLRELTIEEKLMDITLERFTEFHHAVQEDFVNLYSGMVTVFGFGSRIYSKRGALKLDILTALEYENCTEVDFLDIYEDHNIDDDEFYADFASYINTNPVSKAKVNSILINVAEYYA